MAPTPIHGPLTVEGIGQTRLQQQTEQATLIQATTAAACVEQAAQEPLFQQLPGEVIGKYQLTEVRSLTGPADSGLGVV